MIIPVSNVDRPIILQSGWFNTVDNITSSDYIHESWRYVYVIAVKIFLSFWKENEERSILIAVLYSYILVDRRTR